MVEPEEIVSGKNVDREKVSDFINIVKALRVLVPKEEFPYGRINKLLGMAQRHGDCFCESCQEKRKKEMIKVSWKEFLEESQCKNIWDIK